MKKVKKKSYINKLLSIIKMTDFILLYKELFTSDKIRRKSRILNIFFENSSSIFDPSYITENEKYISDLQISFETIIYSNDTKTFDFLDEFEYDIIIFTNLFSFHPRIECENILNMVSDKSEKSKFMFINEIITSEYYSFTAISYIRDILFSITNYNIGRTILLREVYEILGENNFKILDATRLDTNTRIPSYPIEYFLITTCVRYLK